MEKPKMPENAPKFEIQPTIAVTILSDFDKYSTGRMLVKLADTDLIAKDDQDKEVGRIGFSLGGVFYAEFGNATYSIDLWPIFNAIKALHESEHSEVSNA
jgi:hypothetical protein